MEYADLSLSCAQASILQFTSATCYQMAGRGGIVIRREAALRYPVFALHFRRSQLVILQTLDRVRCLPEEYAPGMLNNVQQVTVSAS